jgi:hypothetical protein
LNDDHQSVQQSSGVSGISSSSAVDGLNDDHQSFQHSEPDISSSRAVGRMHSNVGNSFESSSLSQRDILYSYNIDFDSVAQNSSIYSNTASVGARRTSTARTASTTNYNCEDSENESDIGFDVASEMDCIPLLIDQSRLSCVSKPARSSLRTNTKRCSLDPLQFPNCKRVSFETSPRFEDCQGTFLVNSVSNVVPATDFKDILECNQSPFEARMISMRKVHAFVTPGVRTPVDASNVFPGLSNLQLGFDNRHGHSADTPARSPNGRSNLKTRDNIVTENHFNRDFDDGNKENVDPRQPCALQHEDAITDAPCSPACNALVFLIDSQNALNVRFDKNTFLPRSISQHGQTSLPSDTIGLTLDYRNALKDGGCSDKALNDKWISNHVRWVSCDACDLVYFSN